MVVAIHHTTLEPRRPGETLELRLSHRADARDEGLLVCPPNPLLGGDLDNNVIRAVAEAVAEAGWPVMRFNYRGVGASRPHDAVARYEYWRATLAGGDLAVPIADAREALGRARRVFRPIAIAGYSLGAAVALAVALEPAGQVRLLALLGPPLAAHDFGGLSAYVGRTLLVFAGADELDPPPTDLAGFAPHTARVLAGADHFFRGRERELAAMVRDEMPR